MQTKLQLFLKRNKIRNPHLYAETAIEGYDYVLCPLCNERMSMLKKTHISACHGMTLEVFDRLHPGKRKSSFQRKQNIKQALTQIDEGTGLTKHQKGISQAKITLSTPDENGKTGYQKLGQKTKATHLASVDNAGRNGYKRQAHARITTVLENGLTVEENAHIKQRETLLSKNISRVVGASKLSKRVLAPVIELLKEHCIPFYFDKNEYMIQFEGKRYFYDLTIPSMNMVIEYQSSTWHADPTLELHEWQNWKPPKGVARSPLEVLNYDYHKARIAFNQRGLVTFYVWQKSQEFDIGELLCLIKTLIMKF